MVTGLIGHIIRIGNTVSDFGDVMGGEAGGVKAIKEPLIKVMNDLGEFPTVWHVLIMAGVVFLLIGIVAFIWVILQGKVIDKRGGKNETI